MRIDIITVFHNDNNYQQHNELFTAIRAHEPRGGYNLIGIDNRTTNRGFALACNLGAFYHAYRPSPIIGFLNPDSHIRGPFIDAVHDALSGHVVITGCRFNKPQRELDLWGVWDWVCGAAMFVDRGWFRGVGGFDEQFVWGWDDSDLIRQAQRDHKACRSIALPIEHRSPDVDLPEDAAYKRFHFDRGQKRYFQKWQRR